MKNDEDAPRFIPLVKESTVLEQDDPWLPDDIELSHDKHQRVLRTWEPQEARLSPSSNPSPLPSDDEEQESSKTRRPTRTQVIVSLCLFCFGAVAIAFCAVGPIGFASMEQPSPDSSRGSTKHTLAPSMAPTTSPTQRATHEVLPIVSDPSSTPSLAPTVTTSDVLLMPDSSPPPTAFPTISPVETPTASPSAETLIPVFEFGLGSTAGPTVDVTDVSMSPSLESASGQPTATPSPSDVPTIDTANVRVCNGLSSNCNLRVNELVFATLNNAMSSKEDGFYGPSHSRRLEEALEAGYRGLVLKSCDCGVNGIQLCNSFCFSGTREPKRVFENIVDFLIDNPNEVIVVMMIESDKETLRRLFDTVFTEVKGLRRLLYSHPGLGTEWPLLGELIDLSKRLIIFQHGSLDCNVQYACPSGIHNTFSYMFETPTDLNGTQDLLNFNVSCTVQQGSITSDFFILNHYTSGGMAAIDAVETATVVNSMDNIRKRLTACRRKLGRRDPNFVVVNYWSYGDVLEMVDRRNKRLSILLDSAQEDDGVQ